MNHRNTKRQQSWARAGGQAQRGAATIGTRPPHAITMYNALPAYLGGKRRLAPLIFALLSEVLPRSAWAHSLFLDPFCGGGAVALTAKAHGFPVVAADLSERAAVVARALIANSAIKLRRDDILDLFRDPPADYPHVAARYSPSVFAPAQAKFRDRAVARARLRPEPVRSLLLLVLIKAALRMQPMSMLRGTDSSAA